jgi:hypothetical protein
MTQMEKQVGSSQPDPEADLGNDLNFKQNEYVKLIQMKKEYIKELNDAYHKESGGKQFSIFSLKYT